jgi:TDG/mug DNA glycosylase family protein
MGFTKEELARYRDATVPDLIGLETHLLFVGINPGLWTAATQTHFCHPSNRFYPALRIAGLIAWTPDTSVGMSEAERAAFTDKGMAITNLVSRATTRASELSRQELSVGGERLKDLVAQLSPRVVAVAGVTAFRTAFGRLEAALGQQDESLATAELWVVPNPSGLNAHETVDTLADWYSRAANAAGIL